MLSLAKEKAAADTAEIETVPTPAKKQKIADIADGKDSRLHTARTAWAISISISLVFFPVFDRHP